MANTVHIPGGHQRIRFGYSGLILSVPDRVRYRYRLDGFDRAWSEPAAVREAVYTNLPPGRYRFRVMATNPDGIWSTNEAAVPLEVDPLFWQTWWFRLSVVLGCMASILALYRIRLSQLTSRINLRFQERLAERTRIAQELHDTLLQGFLSASMQVHVAADRLPEDSSVKPTLTRALELMRQVIDEGRNAVQGLRSAQSASLDLEHAFSGIQQELVTGEQASEEVDFRVIVDGEQRPLHPVLRDEVYRIGREALINAFRHAQAKKIEMELRYSPNRLRILVRDDGCGIDPNVLQSGRDGHWGLSGMRERADRIGAELHVMSGHSAGTEIELSIPGNVAFQAPSDTKLRWFGKYNWRSADTHRAPGRNGKEK
jgi:signal transduction histidine kinase